jgi:hypothetical protein
MSEVREWCQSAMEVPTLDVTVREMALWDLMYFCSCIEVVWERLVFVIDARGLCVRATVINEAIPRSGMGDTTISDGRLVASLCVTSSGDQARLVCRVIWIVQLLSHTEFASLVP